MKVERVRGARSIDHGGVLTMLSTARRAVAAAVVLPVLALTAACGGDSASENAGEKAAEKMIEEQSGGDVDVDLDGEQVTIETDEGTTSYGGTDRPESLPEDFPLPDGEIVTSVDSPQGAMVTMKPEGDVEEVFSETVAELEEQGWKREYLTEAGGSSSAMFSGDSDDESVILSTESETGQLSFVVTLGG